MRSIEFPAASGGARMSVLGFGCAALMGRASRRESLNALGTAVDAGINFFDNARSYGYGASEGLLGEFLAGKGSVQRDQIILCTKFGILPAPRNWKQMVKPIARAAVRLVPSLRQAAQRQAANQFSAGNFSITNLQYSFEQSLRQLRTDYVDILLMHEAPASVLQQDDLMAALQRLVDQGKVRMAGISAELPVIKGALAKHPAVLTTAQFALNLANIAFTTHTAQHSDLFLVANHPFGGAAGVQGTRERIAALAASPEISAKLREKLIANDPQLLPELVFNVILDGTGISVVVPAMLTPLHIHANVKAVDDCRFTADELAQIRFILASQAGTASQAGPPAAATAPSA